MPPRSFASPRGPFAPPNDKETFRDILLFEERLKTTAASLQRRKSRYQFFLAQLLITIAFLLVEVLLPPRLTMMSRGYTWALRRILPNLYPPDTQAVVHPYIGSGLLFVSVTTLVLFFASGMYSEKIAYANKYVPHANRALRSFNIYLNVRKPPLRSKFPFNPLSFFFPRPEEHSPASSRSSPSPTRVRSRDSSPTIPSTSVPMTPIPPASNPRGELIFSSRVDKNLREGYVRYREGYERYMLSVERKKEELQRAERRKKWWSKLMFWTTWNPPVEDNPTPVGASGVGTGGAPGLSRAASTASSRGGRGGSRSGTPPNPLAVKQRERSRSPVDDQAFEGVKAVSGTTGYHGRSPTRRTRVKKEMGEESGDMRMRVLDRSMQVQIQKYPEDGS